MKDLHSEHTSQDAFWDQSSPQLNPESREASQVPTGASSSRALNPKRPAAKAAAAAVQSSFADGQANKPGPKPKNHPSNIQNSSNSTLSASTLAKKKSQQSANVRRILNYKKGLSTLLDEAVSRVEL